MDGAKVGRRLYEFRNLFSLKTYLLEFKRVINGSSIYVNKKRKNKLERAIDNLIWLIKNHEINKYYNTYGLDIKNFRNPNDFLPYREFSIKRNDDNLKNCDGGNYNGFNRICILRDKSIFASYVADTIGEEYSVKALATTSGDKVNICRSSVTDSSLIDYLESRCEKETILKKISGECGDGVYLLKKQKKHLVYK